MNEHKPNCSSNMQCATVHEDGKCPGFACDCGADSVKPEDTRAIAKERGYNLNGNGVGFEKEYDAKPSSPQPTKKCTCSCHDLKNNANADICELCPHQAENWEKEFDKTFTEDTFCACGGEYDNERHRDKVKSFINSLLLQAKSETAKEIERELKEIAEDPPLESNERRRGFHSACSAFETILQKFFPKK